MSAYRVEKATGNGYAVLSTQERRIVGRSYRKPDAERIARALAVLDAMEESAKYDDPIAAANRYQARRARGEVE